MAAASSCVMDPVKPCRDKLGSDTTASVCATKASKRGPTAATSAAVVSDSGRWVWPLPTTAVGTAVNAPAAAGGVLVCCSDRIWESGTGGAAAAAAAAAGVTLTGGDRYAAMADCRGAGVATGFWGTVAEDAGSCVGVMRRGLTAGFCWADTAIAVAGGGVACSTGAAAAVGGCGEGGGGSCSTAGGRLVLVGGPYLGLPCQPAYKNT